MDIIPARIRITREEYGRQVLGIQRWGRGSLAKLLGQEGPSGEAIEAWEMGRNRVPADYVAALCQLTGVSPAWVLGLSEAGDPREAAPGEVAEKAPRPLPTTRVPKPERANREPADPPQQPKTAKGSRGGRRG